MSAESATVKTSPTQDVDAPGRGARRLLLLQTTLRLIADDGIDAVTHRSVADAANVPLGSTTYWFSSRQEMLREALEYFARLEIETLNERLDAVLGKRLSRRQLVDEFADLLMAAARRAALAHRRPIRAARRRRARRPELEAVCREWSEAWELALAGLFESLGSTDPRLEARMFLAMLDGLLLGQLAAPDPTFEHDVLRPALRTWFGRIEAGAMIIRRLALAALALAGSVLLAACGCERRRRSAGTDDPVPSRHGERQAQRRSDDLQLGPLHRQADRSRVRGRRPGSSQLRRGHQQLRRVLREDAAAADQGRVGRRA